MLKNLSIRQRRNTRIGKALGDPEHELEPRLEVFRHHIGLCNAGNDQQNAMATQILDKHWWTVTCRAPEPFNRSRPRGGASLFNGAIRNREGQKTTRALIIDRTTGQ